jgi:hypothetical protein
LARAIEAEAGTHRKGGDRRGDLQKSSKQNLIFCLRCGSLFLVPLKGTKGSRGALQTHRTAMLEFRTRERFRRMNYFAGKGRTLRRIKSNQIRLNQTESNQPKKLVTGGRQINIDENGDCPRKGAKG